LGLLAGCSIVTSFTGLVDEGNGAADASGEASSSGDAGGNSVADGAASDASAADAGVDAPATDAGGDAADSGLPPGMVLVPAGAFTMGCVATDTLCGPDESPSHTVQLHAFYIDMTGVTNAAYDACLSAAGCTLPACTVDASATDPSFPRACITWTQADQYCTWAGKRLPTEAEWEKAARGTLPRLYPWGNAPLPDCTHGNFNGCVGGPSTGGSYPEGGSQYGAFDLEGNVVEWVADWYDPAYYDGSPGLDPPGPTSGTARSERGTSYGTMNGTNVDFLARVSARAYDKPDYAGDELGFRCAHDAP
jgi:formylglycine-generating enzyme required for sulfatase activity